MDILKNKLDALGLVPMSPAPSTRQVEWLNRKMSAFFHFGINTFTDMEWGDGTENPSIFNPTELDCRQWIKTIRDAGFTAAILTAKHHDGFCLWPSKYTEHSVRNSPYKNGNGDIVKEFTDACAEFGIKAGLYLSPWDRHEKTWGTPDYDDFYANQLTELLTNYGKIWEIWWDGSQSKNVKYDWARYTDIIRTLQPDAVIFGSLGAEPFVEARWVGNESGFAGDPCWSTIDSSSVVTEITSELNSGKLKGNRFLPAEADVSIRPGWFYHAEQDKEVRDVSNLVKLWFLSCGRNSSLLLNLPPDRRGLVHETDAQNLIRFNEVLTNAFSCDLAKKSRVTAARTRCEACKPSNLIDSDYNTFFATCDGFMTPEILFEFETDVSFNCFGIREVIELGHRVTGFEVSALVDGEWKLLSDGQCIGNGCFRHFNRITTSKVRLRITEALYSPVLRSFSLFDFDEAYLFEKEYALSDKNILDNSVAKITRNGNTFDIHLGGIIPFNLITVDSPDYKEFDVSLFNGFDFEPCPVSIDYGKDLIELNFKKPVGWCYRISIEFRNLNEEQLKKIQLGVYLK